MAPSTNVELLKSRIRTVRDWPKPGINFRDVTTLLQDPEAFRVMIEANILPLGAGNRQQVIADPPWAAVAVRLVRPL